jgi:hypothetical protein
VWRCLKAPSAAQSGLFHLDRANDLGRTICKVRFAPKATVSDQGAICRDGPLSEMALVRNLTSVGNSTALQAGALPNSQPPAPDGTRCRRCGIGLRQAYARRARDPRISPAQLR